MAEKKRLIVIDANSIIHRAFHALPPLTTKKGKPVGAVYGFLLVFLKTIREFKPDFVIACFDFPAPTFRHQAFKAYKAKRPPAPKELYRQIPIVKEILKSFNVSVFEKEGFEADDLIGTVASKFIRKQVFPKAETIVLSGDLDTLQLINNNTRVYLLRRGVRNTVLYGESLVKEKYSGLSPGQLIDFRALKGDPSDNIPGVTGIGEKTTIDLLKKFGTLENLYAQVPKTTKIKTKVKELLVKQKEQAFLSKKLAQIDKNVPITLSLKKCQWGKYEKEKVLEIFERLEFHTLAKKLTQLEKENPMSQNKLKLW